jgi:hypothetical protein
MRRRSILTIFINDARGSLLKYEIIFALFFTDLNMSPFYWHDTYRFKPRELPQQLLVASPTELSISNISLVSSVNLVFLEITTSDVSLNLHFYHAVLSCT